MRTRLATRLVLSHLLVVVVGLGLAGTGLLSQTRRYFVDAERASLFVQARVAANSCDALCLSSRTSTANVTNGQLPSASNVTQRKAQSSSNVQIATGLANQISSQLPSDVRVVRTTDSARGGLAERALAGTEVSQIDAERITVAAPMRQGASVVGAVVVTGSLDDVNAVLADLRRQVLVALGIGSLAGLLFGLWRARSISKPIRELTLASRSIADGHFDQPLPKPRGNDELSELATTFEDMRHRVQDELELRNAFVADASHELRSPLTAIRGAVEILQNGGADRPEVRERFLSSLGRETDRLLVLIDNLLDLQTHDQVATRFVPVRVDEIVRSVAEDLRPLAAAKQLSVDVELTTPITVKGAADQLRQVIVNVVDNAIIHAPPGSSITLRAHMGGATVQVEVEDGGPGIPVDQRERVFERFVRLDGARDRSHGGAGLGLSIARSLAEAHGGTLTLHEPQGGFGTLAILDLPLPDEATA